MTIPFRDYHLLTILKQAEQQATPLDIFLRSYFRAHKAVGSKDRKQICTTLYTLIRNRLLFDHFLDTPTWEKRLALFKEGVHEKNHGLPRHIQVSFPQEFYSFLEASLGEDRAYAFCRICNEQAPTTIRVNTLLTTRQALFEQLAQEHEVKLCKKSPFGIEFKHKTPFFTLPAFKQGLFEVQDEHSQLIAQLVEATPGDLVLDYCAGSGGKALAIAPLMGNLGQLFLHDIRTNALQEAKKRLKRAQVHNAQLIHEAEKKHRLKQKMDWVLVDAPCSGTGTLRRNPDMKWKWGKNKLSTLIEQQRTIFEEALTYVKPEGKIVYATCSVLKEENEEQVQFFLQHLPLKVVGEPLSLMPEPDGGDGFFGIVFQKTTSLRYKELP